MPWLVRVAAALSLLSSVQTCMKVQPSHPVIIKPKPPKPPVTVPPTVPPIKPPAKLCATCKKPNLQVIVDPEFFWNPFTSDVTSYSINGCLKRTMKCEKNGADLVAILYNDSEDPNTEWNYEDNTVPQSHDLVCNGQGEWEDPANGRTPTTAKCSYFGSTPPEPPNKCTVCTKEDLPVVLDPTSFWNLFTSDTQMAGSDGCLVRTMKCEKEGADLVAILYNDSPDPNTEWNYEDNTAPQSHDLVCNVNGKWEDKANGRLPTSAKCSYFTGPEPEPCTLCKKEDLNVVTNPDNFWNPFTSDTQSADANGCLTRTMKCEKEGADLVAILYNDSEDPTTEWNYEDNETPQTHDLVCNAQGKWEDKTNGRLPKTAKCSYWEPDPCTLCKKEDITVVTDPDNFWNPFTSDTQTEGADGCLVRTMKCEQDNAALVAILYNESEDPLTEWNYEDNAAPQSHDLVCNAEGKWEDKANGKLPTTAKCSYFVDPCLTCTKDSLDIPIDPDNFWHEFTDDTIAPSGGCLKRKLKCEQSGVALLAILFNDGTDPGTEWQYEDNAAPQSHDLVCNENGQWVDATNGKIPISAKCSYF